MNSNAGDIALSGNSSGMNFFLPEAMPGYKVIYPVNGVWEYKTFCTERSTINAKSTSSVN